MGIIQRQSIKTLIVSLAGVLIAGFSMLFVYKLDESIYGTAQFIYGVAAFLTPFASLGIASTTVRFYPSFLEQDYKYLNSMLLYLGIISVGFLIVYFLFQDYFYELLRITRVDEDGLIKSYTSFIIPLVLVLNLNYVLMAYSSNKLRIVIPEIINTLSYKIFLPILILLVYFNYLQEDYIATAILIFFIIVSCCLVLYLCSIDAIKLRSGLLSLSRKKLSEIARYSGFSGLNTIGGTLAFRVDIIMIGTMLTMEAVGIYSILMFLTNVIEIPRKSISKIASPIISKAWTDHNVDEIRSIYKKSSINSLVAGVGIFLIIWYSLPILDFLSIGEDRFYNGRYVFLFLAIGKMIDSLMSVNSEIIIHSKYYKVNLYFLLFLGISNICLNYILITMYQLLGAAIATSISYLLYNVMKFIYIWYRFKLTPFSKNTLILISISVSIFLLCQMITYYMDLLIVDLLVLIIICISYSSIVYISKISLDINQMIQQFVNTGMTYVNKKRLW